MDREKALLRSLYPPSTLAILEETVSRFPVKPLLSIIAGSGWGEVVDGQDIRVFTYREIGLVFRSEVEGHSGVIRLTQEQGVPVLVFEGRPHLYQGYRYEEVILPVTLSFLSGAQVLLITNASGSLHRRILPGNLCLLTDQVDFTFVPDPPVFSRKPCFSQKLQALICESAIKRDISLFRGTYVGVLGPSFETPAEIRMLARFGEVVGMSTVKESKAATNLGLPVCGVSLVTNWGSGISSLPLSHQEVLETSLRSRFLLREFVGAFIQGVAQEWT